MIEQPAALPYGGTRPLTDKLVVNTRELAYSKSQSPNIPGMKPRQIAAEKLTYIKGLKHTLKRSHNWAGCPEKKKNTIFPPQFLIRDKRKIAL